MLNDIRFALRQLRKSPGFTFVVIITLALGIGANAAIFTLVRGVLIKPLVNRDEARLIYIRQSAPGEGQENITWSMPEIHDLKTRIKTLSEFGDFSTISFTLIGLGEPREVIGGVVNGSFFEVMGLRPVLGRLIGPQDDGPKAAGVVVLTYRFWSNALNRDPSVIGKTVRLGDRSATIIGVLEPCVPYPQETEIIANVASSPHHLAATMVTERTHRMTELFARLAAGTTLDQARAELRSVYATIKKDHPEAYSKRGDFQISAKLLRDQITSGARTVLIVLLAASALVFVVACSNVANLILARTVRREGELAVRTALGASKGALRRMLLAESVLLCGAGAGLGVLSAQPMVEVLARYAVAFLGSRTRSYRRFQSPLGRRGTGHCRDRFWRLSHVFPPTRPVHCTSRAAAFGPAAAKVVSVCSLSRKSAHHSCCWPARVWLSLRSSRCKGRRPVWTRAMSLPSTFPPYFTARHASKLSIFTRKSYVASMRFRASIRPHLG